MERKVIGVGGDKVMIFYEVYPRVLVSVSILSYFLSVVYSF